MPEATVQITLRLPPGLIARVDAQATNRTAAVIEALEAWATQKENDDSHRA